MSEELWHIPPAEPGPLPSKAFDGEGNAWTDLPNNPDGRAACGYVIAPAKPVIDPTREQVEWVDGAWTVIGIIPTQIPMLFLVLELIDRGFWDDIEADVEAIADPVAKRHAQERLKRTVTVHRAHPLVAFLQAQRGWSDDLVDEIAAAAAVRT